MAPLEKQFRRSRGHDPAAGVDEGAIATGLGVDQIPVERLGRSLERRFEAEGEVDLIGVTGADALANVLDRVVVVIFRQPARPGLQRVAATAEAIRPADGCGTPRTRPAATATPRYRRPS